MSDGGKGSGRRPGSGYQDGWARIFGQQKTLEQEVFEDQVRPYEDGLAAHLIGGCTHCSHCASTSECRPGAVGAFVCLNPPRGEGTMPCKGGFLTASAST